VAACEAFSAALAALNHPQMWDLFAWRIMGSEDKQHHLTGGKWKIYPTYDNAASPALYFPSRMARNSAMDSSMGRVRWLHAKRSPFVRLAHHGQ
jgi:hypothetical protein